jgi:hypothetical protein
MTTYNPTFSASEFEFRNYTGPWLTPTQSTEVDQTEDRVNSQLDFLAQMLGWNGPNYWGNLPSTPNQKRQLLGGTFGVYNSYVIPKIYEIRNWSTEVKDPGEITSRTITDAIVIDRLQFLQPGRTTQVARILLGDDVYQIQSVDVEGDKYIISLGELPQSFYDQIAANVPLRVDIPTYRPAPFYRPSVGASGDYSFTCGNDGSSLTLYPSYDTEKKFPLRFPVIFAGSTYYFDQPIYLSLSPTLAPDVTPTYDPNLNLWFISIPEEITDSANLTGFLAQANSNVNQANNYSLQVVIRPWEDNSDWNSVSVLDNFRGVWGNKGGDLPFNFVFDSLNIHGFNESQSIYLPPIEGSLSFNQIVNYIYYQKTVVSEMAPGGAQQGDLWWNDTNGVLSVWLPSESGCGSWVEIDYRQSPQQTPAPTLSFVDMTAFRGAASTIPVGTVVRIDDITGLNISDNVLGVQGTLTAPASLILHQQSTPYWIPDEFRYANVASFSADSQLLPYKTPVKIFDATGLSPTAIEYTVQNLGKTITGDYDVLLLKYYNNKTWEIYPDSILKYIALSSLYGGLKQGEMWWDYLNPDPNTRAAAIYYSSPSAILDLAIVYPGRDLDNGVFTAVPLIALSGTGGQAVADITVVGNQVISFSVSLTGTGDKYQIGDLVGPDPLVYPQLVGAIFEVTETTSESWVAVNSHPQSAAPSPTLDLSTVLFYCNGTLVNNGVAYVDDDFTFTYTHDTVNGTYDFTYFPLTFKGKAQLPTITISDNLTTTYRADITELVFSGITYYMSPNVYNAETTLRLWKTQDLQVAETVSHLSEKNYINPLLADLNNGPGLENWERYFVRLPLDYGRNGAIWQKVALTCQDFGYWGSSIDPEAMRCPPEDDLPVIYEELFLYDQPVPDYTYVYSEPYLYSNLAYSNSVESGVYQNAGVFPTSEIEFDEFNEAQLISYDPLHNRQAFTDLLKISQEIARIEKLLSGVIDSGQVDSIVDLTNQLSRLRDKVYGDWQGDYVNINPCINLTGFFTTDLINGGLEPVDAPVWDASIYKFAPTCQNAKASYNVDANHYKIGYAYFVADASAAEDAFFDISKEASWRYPVTQPKTLYLTPR